ncbi:monovalent cation/H(+) antiporter subunit G [Nocardioides caldifontis]|uniref:monovalent cation/H(+) antiporter subunit G n=1 Tax=Nocardioides caldifontis TaxID=2588938 RepID=UPI0011DF70EA|nr:monovalent cation/H(+) antiporter subunit G [Nocardioides caldifontis]
MSWTDVLDVAAAACLLAGCLLSLLAALGMIRFPDLLSRMHAATKPQVLGLVLVLVGLGLRLRDERTLGLLLLVVLFQFSTAPIASHMAGRAAFRAGQVDHDLLVTDELSETLESHEEPRGAP